MVANLPLYTKVEASSPAVGTGWEKLTKSLKISFCLVSLNNKSADVIAKLERFRNKSETFTTPTLT